LKASYTKEKFEQRFTKTSQAVKFISELEKLDLSQISDEDLESKIDDCFSIIPYTSATVPEGSELFRARVNIGNKPYDLVKDIYVPPIDLIKSYGRANRPNEQIFYSASNFKLASFEVIQNLKNSITPKAEIAYLTIGVWRVREALHLTNVIYSPILHSLREDILEAFTHNQKLLNNGTLREDTVTAHNLISQFFADQYTKSNIKSHHDYKISAFYSRRLKAMNELIAPDFQSEKFDGINYPSVAMKYRGDNQALFVESVERKLELINTIQVLCGNLDFEKLEFLPGIMHEAESIINGTIKWKTEPYQPR
jgi:hypothetical protein